MVFTGQQYFVNIPNVLFNVRTHVEITLRGKTLNCVIFFFIFPLLDVLFKVRKQFVKNVSEEVINQLLDDLLCDRVVNDGEKNSILQSNSTIANRARSLIDTVMKKGDAASWKMINHLKSNDPTLHSNLGLPCGQPAPPGERYFKSN